MICSITFEQWGIVATVAISIVALVVSIIASRKSGKVAREQVKLTNNILEGQRAAEISDTESELARVRAEYEQLKTRVDIESDAEQSKCFGLGVRDAYVERHASQYRAYDDRIAKLTKKLDELKAQGK